MKLVSSAGLTQALLQGMVLLLLAAEDILCAGSMSEKMWETHWNGGYWLPKKHFKL